MGDNENNGIPLRLPAMPPFDRRIFEQNLTLNHIELLIDYHEKFRFTIFPCRFCANEWSTAAEYSEHLPCAQCGDSELERKQLEVAKYEAEWKTCYNEIHEMAKGIVGGTRPLKAVPYCTCDTFKDTQDCECMQEKRTEAFDKLINEAILPFYNAHHEYTLARMREEMVKLNEKERIALETVTGRKMVRRKKIREIKKNKMKEGKAMAKQLLTDYNEIVSVNAQTILNARKILYKEGRPPIDRQVLNRSEIESVIEKHVDKTKNAYMLTRLWSEFNGTEKIDQSMRVIQEGLNERNLSKIEQGGNHFKNAFLCIQRTSVFINVLAFLSFHDQEFHDPKLTAESNEKVRRALNYRLANYVEELTEHLIQYPFPTESAFQAAKNALDMSAAVLPICNQPRVTKALREAIESFDKWHNKSNEVMALFRDNALNNDWKRASHDLFYHSVHVHDNCACPYYLEDDVRETVFPERSRYVHEL